MYEVEDGIPVPAKIRSKYPIKQLELGQSFMIPSSELSPTQISSIRQATTKFAKETGRKFTVRKTDGGLRVWRIS